MAYNEGVLNYDHPEGIIITIGGKWLKAIRGIRPWYRDFRKAMDHEEGTYWIRQGNQSKYKVMYVYLLIGGRIRYRINFVDSYPRGFMNFDDNRELFANAWICTTGPMVKAPYRIERKGFQGFRYTPKLF